MPANLTLYVKGWCPWCVRAKAYLDNRDYKYDEVDVDKDRSGYDEMIKSSGQTYTPTLGADGKILADFGPDDLEDFLKENSILP